MKIHVAKGHTLLEVLISTAIGAMLCICAVHFICMVMHTHAKIQQKFKLQHAKLIAKHYISSDLYSQTQGIAACTAAREMCSHLLTPAITKLIAAKSIKPLSDLLVIYTWQGQIVYYLRNSIVPGNTEQKTYALYRDDIEHNAQALVEDIKHFAVNIVHMNTYIYKVTVYITFTNADKQEITCVLNNH